MKLCYTCNGYGWYPVATGNSHDGIIEQMQDQCSQCEGFGHVFSSPEEKQLFCILTTEEEREGFFGKEADSRIKAS